MAKQTSSHFETAKNGAENHNERKKDLDYVRKELSHLNQTWKAEGFTTVEDARKEVANRYKAHQGKKLPKNATPIQETVVVISEQTTMKQLQNLAKEIQKTWGLKPLAIYTHLDEGHEKAWKKGKWIPNLHAHMIFDCTDSEGLSIKPSSEKQRRSQQSKWEKKEQELAEKEGREPRKFIAPDAWKLPTFDYMQDLTAECLGMERGVSSSRRHIESLKYKLIKMQEEKEQLLKENQELKERVGIVPKVMSWFNVGEEARIRKELEEEKEGRKKDIEELQEQHKTDKAEAVKQAYQNGRFAVRKEIADATGEKWLNAEGKEVIPLTKHLLSTIVLWHDESEKLDAEKARADNAERENQSLKTRLQRLDPANVQRLEKANTSLSNRNARLETMAEELHLNDAALKGFLQKVADSITNAVKTLTDFFTERWRGIDEDDAATINEARQFATVDDLVKLTQYKVDVSAKEIKDVIDDAEKGNVIKEEQEQTRSRGFHR